MATNAPVTPKTAAPSQKAAAPQAPASSEASLNADTNGGTTTVNDSVVAKIAGIAAREVPGVHALGGGVSRAIGAIRSVAGGTDHGQGISVEVGETQAAADVTVIAEYPVPLQQVADGIRSAVTEAIEGLVGLQVTEVNVTIADVHIPSDDEGSEQNSRVS